MSININKEFAYHKKRNKKAYFEGWYYRITTPKMSIGIVLGMVTNSKDNHAFIQTLDTVTNKSQYICFPLSEVQYDKDPFHIQIGNNHFYQDAMILHVNQEIKIDLNVTMHDFTYIDKTLYAPTIMGPFSYIPNMECIHSIYSLHHQVKGQMKINNRSITLHNAIGYIEKDRGTSFPNTYLWLQSNTLEAFEKCCFFLSIASIPLGIINFTGCIGILLLGEEQIRFGTYYGAKVKTIRKLKNGYKVILTQGTYRMCIHIQVGELSPLLAPTSGNMDTTVYEGLDATITVHLYKEDRLFKNLTFYQAGCEIHQY